MDAMQIKNNWARKKFDELLPLLESTTSEVQIAIICKAVVKDLIKAVPNKHSRAHPMGDLRKAVRARFPDTQQKLPGYYFTDSGKGQNERWEHLALRYLNRNLEDWQKRFDDPAYPEQQSTHQATQQPAPQSTQKSAAKSTKQPAPQSTQKSTAKSTKQPAQTPEPKSTQKLEDMNIEQLQLDSETHQIVEKALTHSGMSLADFTRQALRVYAKTITGKVSKHTEDLAAVPTEKLLTDTAYGTHPSRPEELTKRAIRAIQIYNDEHATSNQDRWCITQSIICELTGSRASSVGKVLESFKTMIEAHNIKYELNSYSNRKRGKDVHQEIRLAFLVPDGMDL